MAQRKFDFHDLSIPERLELVEEIWDSIADQANEDAQVLPVSDTQRAELRRRRAGGQGESVDDLPWDAVRRNVFKRGE